MFIELPLEIDIWVPVIESICASVASTVKFGYSPLTFALPVPVIETI